MKCPWGYSNNSEDCLDTNEHVYPTAEEMCDGIINDCSNFENELDPDEYDNDGDGFVECEWDPETWQGSSLVRGGRDCNDVENEGVDIHPEADEICDDVDNNCDTIVDTDAIDKSTFYRDNDGDNFGATEDSTSACVAPEGFVTDNTDCNDTTSDIYPQNTEICDELDNDCDGDVDENVQLFFYNDIDGDGFGDRDDLGTQSCIAPPNMVENRLDCNDGAFVIHPEADEICDGVDNNCDTIIDTDAIDKSTFYRDNDGDGFGTADDFANLCFVEAGFVDDNTDCLDDNQNVYPNALQLCDGIQNDCASSGIPLDEIDNDGDGFVECTVDENGWYGSPISGGEDCDDGLTHGTVRYPTAPELCDGLDNDCDGSIPSVENDDDLDGYVECTVNPDAWYGPMISGGEDCDDYDTDEKPGVTWYTDSDGDDFGDPDNSSECERLNVTDVLDNTDCDDGLIHGTVRYPTAQNYVMDLIMIVMEAFLL